MRSPTFNRFMAKYGIALYNHGLRSRRWKKWDNVANKWFTKMTQTVGSKTFVNNSEIQINKKYV